ncbi:MAG: SpoIIE family protein phosphatase [Bacteroidales bacterium]|nr:SpoIIE family protein phosphatase [Bacteroidales bacterium]
MYSTSQAHSQADSLNKYMDLAQQSDTPKDIFHYGEIALFYAQNIKDTNAMIEAYNQMAWAQSYINPQKSIAYYTMQYKLACEINNEPQMAKALYNLGGTFSVTKQYLDAIKMMKSALKIFNKLNDPAKIARVYRDMAINCANMELYASAYDYMDHALEIDKQCNDSVGLAYDYSSRLQLYIKDYNSKKSKNLDPNTNPLIQKAMQSCDSAMMCMPKDIDRFDELFIMATYYNHKSDIAIYYADYTENLTLKKKFIEEARGYNQQYLKMAQEMHDEESSTQGWLQCAEIFFMMGNIDKAISITDSLKKNINDSLWPTLTINTYKASSKYHTARGDYKQALNDLQTYDLVRSQFMNDNAIKQNAEFRTDLRKEAEITELIEKQDHENAIRDEEIKRQRVIIIMALLMFVIVATAAVLIARALKINRHNNQVLNDKNKQLHLQQKEIIAQQNTINKQKEAAERANYITTQSINYALHIQRAAMPSMESIRKQFPDSFVYYKPKDIVSGDFYYIGKNKDMDIFVLADCTGHGVPGGFLSMLGMSTLKEILSNPDKEMNPGEMLDMMREYVKQLLSNEEEMHLDENNSDEEDFSTADGMDMSILALDTVDHKLQYAGAYQSLFIARNNDVIRLKGDRMPVGRHINEDDNFSTLYFTTQKGDMLYLSSDGIPSQIGYSGVKFMTKRLIEFFKNNHNLPCEQQHNNISNLMNEWLKDSIQIDDLSLVGIRID